MAQVSLYLAVTFSHRSDWLIVGSTSVKAATPRLPRTMTGNKLTAREMAKRWDEVRPIFVTAIAKAIDKKTRNNRRWVKQSDLVPAGVAASKFQAIFKKGMAPHFGGTFRCDLVDDDANLMMIRHVFRGKNQYLWVGPSSMMKEDVLEAIRNYPKENARNTTIATDFWQECENDL